MENEKINLTVMSPDGKPVEIILREGEALKLTYPKKVTSSGLIDSARKYSVKVTDKAKALVEYSVENLTIKLYSDPSDEKGAEISGKLSLNPDLVAFGINKNKFFSSSDLIKFARSYAHCFANIDEAKELIKTLQNFEVKFEQTHIKTDDRKGATEDSVKNAILFHKGEVKKDLKLNMPIHLGGEKVEFNLEIEIEKQGTAPAFAFYSLDMENTIRDANEKVMKYELNALKEFVCIQQS